MSLRATRPAALALVLFLSQWPGPAAAATPPPSPVPSPCPSAAASAAPKPSPSASGAPGTADLCARKASLERVRAQLGTDLASGLAAEQALQASLDQNRRQQAALEAAVAQSEAKSVALRAELRDLEAEMAVLQGRIDRDQRQLARVARAVYFSPPSLEMRLLQAGSIRAMLVRSAETDTIGAHARALGLRLKADRAQLRSDRQRKQAALDQEVAVSQQLTADRLALAALGKQQEDTRVQLVRKIEAIRRELAGVEAQSVAVAQQISAQLAREQQALIGQAVEQAWAQLALWLQTNHFTGTPKDGSSLAPPMAGAVLTQPFGPTDLWFEPPFQGFAHFHTGLDLAAPENAPVLAAADGEVAVVGSGQVGYGNYVILVHAGGLATLYGHLNQVLVRVGDRVVQVQPIGLEGSTGNSTGAHLHFEVRLGGVPVDPAPFLAGPRH